MSKRHVLIFNRFERFWHWTQAIAIFVLLFTGFGIHGLHPFGDFETLVSAHVLAAVYLMVLWVFAIFWHLTTGSWRHYVPTSQGLLRVARYYAIDIFKGEDHPYRKHFWRKHNPLQAITYLALKLVLFPAIWLSGLAYLSYGLWSQGAMTNGALEWVALAHTAAAFAMLVFIILHIYLLTTGHSFAEHVRPMVTGYDEIELSDVEEAYLRQDEPGRLRR
ncbi:MAG: cytochrome b/b6 domain-containing protein [Gammaproteobacteria bacterium]|nr:cytochrome b/b6 domain-containing protein [Gammaproteobacteria bacterium]MCB1925856.1 cytochrome b/b6 domain-containing protein [Gammaproteobacteria bacterium]